MSLTLTMFSDFVCPYCYIGHETVRRLKHDFDLELEWRGFQIHPDWPAEGADPEAFYRQRGMDMAERRSMWERIRAMGQAVGLDMMPPRVLTNSRKALEACEFARENGLADEFISRVYRAYFSEGKNIGEEDVVLQLAEEVGLPRKSLADALASNHYLLKLKNHALLASAKGITGVPTYLAGNYAIVGAQSEETMRKLLERLREKLAQA